MRDGLQWMTAGFVGGLMLLSGTTAAIANAVSLPYSQNFQSAAPSGNAPASYPEFSASLSGGTAVVDAGGVLRFTGAADSGVTDQIMTVTPSPTPTGEIVINADITASNSNGDYNVGMVIGGNRLVFHPGYADGGAFRVEGNGGFGNTNMGYVPANNVMQHYEVHSFPNGQFTIKVTDSADSSHVYNTSFTNLASYGGAIGFLRSGPPAGDGQYDNLTIAAVPEPASLGIVGLGLITLMRRRPNRNTATR